MPASAISVGIRWRFISAIPVASGKRALLRGEPEVPFKRIGFPLHFAGLERPRRPSGQRSPGDCESGQERSQDAPRDYGVIAPSGDTTRRDRHHACGQPEHRRPQRQIRQQEVARRSHRGGTDLAPARRENRGRTGRRAGYRHAPRPETFRNPSIPARPGPANPVQSANSFPARDVRRIAGAFPGEARRTRGTGLRLALANSSSRRERSGGAAPSAREGAAERSPPFQDRNGAKSPASLRGTVDVASGGAMTRGRSPAFGRFGARADNEPRRSTGPRAPATSPAPESGRGGDARRTGLKKNYIARRSGYGRFLRLEGDGVREFSLTRESGLDLAVSAA